MDYEDIHFNIQDGVAIIELHRPEQLNACTGKMLEELGDAYRICDSNDDIRSVVLTGAGRAFCSGTDMSSGAGTFSKADRKTFLATGKTAVDPPAWEVRKPVIAAMNGHAIGLGLCLALQCDIRIAALEGKYAVLQVRRGMIADGGGTWILPRLVGMARAAELQLMGRTISGNETVEIGIASRALPASDVLPTAIEMARDIAINTSPLAVAIAKRLLWENPSLTRAEAIHREAELIYQLMGLPDAMEGPLAWLERRQPQWKSSVNNDWPNWPS